MPDRSTGAWRRPEAATEQTGQIDMTDLFARLDALDAKVEAKHRRPATKARRPISWQAVTIVVVVVLALCALVGFLAAIGFFAIVL
ncbi:hypothetical protein LQ327_08900 [Actinomycetospora endophytica]|uniref:DUF3040 family protein n=1 Tax=Actinomycetospora endophytica TaxID=2291215 RepID=A0ABS8P5H7_9PSEU|nr:hypothetical protein [Actinomycetospora endophytica]MCD2193499.1 hypothetical protein [Actinomycetospora endophytica]